MAKPPKPKTSPAASVRSQSELVLSAALGTNAPVFRQILELHVEPGSLVADVTYGEGAFWRDVPAGAYDLRATDLKTGVDCRDLPYEDGSVDCVVFDPPYIEGLHRTSTEQLAGTGTFSPFRSRYSNGKAGEGVRGTAASYHGAVLSLYLEAAVEAHRVLRNHGMYIVKCQDEVSANRQWWTHVEIMNALEDRFYCKDLFVVVRTNKPTVAGLVKQVHARKNHSYFLVFMKLDPAHPNRLKPPKTTKSSNKTSSNKTKSSEQNSDKNTKKSSATSTKWSAKKSAAKQAATSAATPTTRSTGKPVSKNAKKYGVKPRKNQPR